MQYLKHGRKYTGRKYGSEPTHLHLTEEAQKVYSSTDGIELYEYDWYDEYTEESGYRYDIKELGVWLSDYTEEGVNLHLEPQDWDDD